MDLSGQAAARFGRQLIESAESAHKAAPKQGRNGCPRLRPMLFWVRRHFLSQNASHCCILLANLSALTQSTHELTTCYTSSLVSESSSMFSISTSFRMLDWFSSCGGCGRSATEEDSEQPEQSKNMTCAAMIAGSLQIGAEFSMRAQCALAHRFLALKGSVSRIVIFAYIFFPVASSNTIERPCADVWQSIPWSSAQLCGQHDFALVSFWRFHNPMKVVAQQTPSMNLPPSLLTIFSQRFHEPNMILFVFKNVLSAIPTVHHMVDLPSNTASRSTRIVFSLAADSRGGKSRSRQNGFHCAWRTQ